MISKITFVLIHIYLNTIEKQLYFFFSTTLAIISLEMLRVFFAKCLQCKYIHEIQQNVNPNYKHKHAMGHCYDKFEEMLLLIYR